jgi:hypothetical protein
MTRAFSLNYPSDWKTNENLELHREGLAPFIGKPVEVEILLSNSQPVQTGAQRIIVA